MRHLKNYKLFLEADGRLAPAFHPSTENRTFSTVGHIQFRLSQWKDVTNSLIQFSDTDPKLENYKNKEKKLIKYLSP